MSDDTHDQVRTKVRDGYAEIARTGAWSGVRPSAAKSSASSCGGGGCCGPAALTTDQIAMAVGYAAEDLATLPEGANLGLSCGNPTAIASLADGEVVLDLGSGAGFDCFLAGPRVGSTGKVIGVDMTPEMLSRARENVASYRHDTGLDNVEFRLGEIEHLPVADASVDVVLSNCVVNLAPDKAQVWREIARVLAPGGRLAISDLALLKPLPEAVRKNVEALVGCIAGADLVETTRAHMVAAGLADVRLTPKANYVEALVNAGDPLYADVAAALPPGARISDYIVSLDIQARRPG